MIIWKIGIHAIAKIQDGPDVNRFPDLSMDGRAQPPDDESGQETRQRTRAHGVD